jgi:LmbE family N-acetylglucosaminyl deacetylase
MTLPTPETRPRLLGVYAHPDDELFCSAGTFARYAAAGCEIMVISATRGQAGQIRGAHVATRQTLGQVREAELRLACARIGVKHVACWDYLDGTLAEVDASDLQARVAGVIHEYRPDMVFTFGSDGASGHPDHIAISRATTVACSSNRPSWNAPPRLYHALFPRRRLLLQDHLVRWLAEQRPDFRFDPRFVHGLLVLMEAASALRYADDHAEVKWFPTGSHIIEEGEAPTALFLLLSGYVDVVREDSPGRCDVVTRLQPGQFFGEQGVARNKPRTAHVVAADHATCLVLRPRQPTGYEGRGEGARLVSRAPSPACIPTSHATAIHHEVGRHLQAKLDALAAYRTQFPVQTHLLPHSMLQDLFGVEYFVPVQLPADISREETRALSSSTLRPAHICRGNGQADQPRRHFGHSARLDQR